MAVPSYNRILWKRVCIFWFNEATSYSQKAFSGFLEAILSYKSHTSIARKCGNPYLDQYSSLLFSGRVSFCRPWRIPSKTWGILLNFSKKRVICKVECATLFQKAGMKQAKICKILKKSSSWVSKWCRATEFFDSPRSGRPVTALTPENLEKLDQCEGKVGQSNRVVGPILGISKSSASRGFKKLHLYAYRRGVQSRMRPKHVKQRYVVSKVMRHEG